MAILYCAGSEQVPQRCQMASHLFIAWLLLKKLRDTLDRGEGEQVLASFQQDDDSYFASNSKFVFEQA